MKGPDIDAESVYVFIGDTPQMFEDRLLNPDAAAVRFVDRWRSYCFPFTLDQRTYNWLALFDSALTHR